MSLTLRREHRVGCCRVLFNSIDRLATEVDGHGDGADALMLIKHRPNDVELSAIIRSLLPRYFVSGCCFAYALPAFCATKILSWQRPRPSILRSEATGLIAIL